MAKEYFPFTGKIPFEGKDSKNVMAFHYYEPEKVVMGKNRPVLTRLADRPAATSGTRQMTPFSALRTRWTLVSRLWISWVSSTSASTM